MPDTLPLDPQIQTAIDEIATGFDTKIQAAKAEAKAEAEAAAAAALAAKDAELEAVKKEGILAALAGVKSRLGI
jgi:hypothetical protein